MLSDRQHRFFIVRGYFTKSHKAGTKNLKDCFSLTLNPYPGHRWFSGSRLYEFLTSAETCNDAGSSGMGSCRQAFAGIFIFTSQSATKSPTLQILPGVFAVLFGVQKYLRTQFQYDTSARFLPSGKRCSRYSGAPAAKNVAPMLSRPGACWFVFMSPGLSPGLHYLLSGKYML